MLPGVRNDPFPPADRGTADIKADLQDLRERVHSVCTKFRYLFAGVPPEKQKHADAETGKRVRQDNGKRARY